MQLPAAQRDDQTKGLHATPAPRQSVVRSRRWAELGLALAIATATVLRLEGLGRKSFWLDEAFSVALARSPWPVFAHEIWTREANMSLYYLLLRWWLHLGGSESAVRLLSALCGIAAVPLVYAIGARLIGRRTGVTAAWFLALDPLHLFASQDSRAYALAVLLITCSSWAFAHLVGSRADRLPQRRDGQSDAGRLSTQPRPDESGVGWAILYALSSGLAAYAHFYIVFVLLAQWGSLAIVRPASRVQWRRLVAAGAVMVVLWLPLGAFMLQGPHTNIDWLGSAFRTGIGRLIEATLTPVGFVIAVGYGILLLALLSFGIWAATSARTAARRWAFVFFLFWAMLPVVVPLLVSVTLRPILEPRYLVVCVPGIALLSAALVAEIGVGHARRAAIVGILAIEMTADWAYLGAFRKEDWRGAAAIVLANARPGDGMIFYAPYVGRAFDYYARQWPSAAITPTTLYPPNRYRDFGVGAAGLTLGQAVDTALVSAPRLWLIVSHAAADTACTTALDEALQHVYAPAKHWELPAIDVTLYVRDLTRARGSGAEAPAIGEAAARSCPQQ